MSGSCAVDPHLEKRNNESTGDAGNKVGLLAANLIGGYQLIQLCTNEKVRQ